MGAGASAQEVSLTLREARASGVNDQDIREYCRSNKLAVPADVAPASSRAPRADCGVNNDPRGGGKTLEYACARAGDPERSLWFRRDLLAQAARLSNRRIASRRRVVRRRRRAARRRTCSSWRWASARTRRAAPADSSVF